MFSNVLNSGASHCSILHVIKRVMHSHALLHLKVPQNTSVQRVCSPYIYLI